MSKDEVELFKFLNIACSLSLCTTKVELFNSTCNFYTFVHFTMTIDVLSDLPFLTVIEKPGSKDFNDKDKIGASCSIIIKNTDVDTRITPGRFWEDIKLVSYHDFFQCCPNSSVVIDDLSFVEPSSPRIFNRRCTFATVHQHMSPIW